MGQQETVIIAMLYLYFRHWQLLAQDTAATGPLRPLSCSRLPEALSHGGSGRGSKSSQAGQGTNVFEASAGRMFVNIPLVEASPMTKFKAGRHSKVMAGGVDTGRGRDCGSFSQFTLKLYEITGPHLHLLIIC